MFTGEIANSSHMGLSAREMEIIGLVADGLTNQEIAEKLTISKRTVDNHVSNMFTKTGSKNRVALLNWAMDLERYAGMDSIVVLCQMMMIQLRRISNYCFPL